MTDGTTATDVSPVAEGYTAQSPVSTEYHPQPEPAMSNHPFYLASLSEDDMRSVLSQIATAFVNQSQLAAQVKTLAEQADHDRFVRDQQIDALRSELTEMRQSLITAQAERDTMRRERDEAQRSADDWHSCFNRELDGHNTTRQDLTVTRNTLAETERDRDAHSRRADTAEAANHAANDRIGLLERLHSDERDRAETAETFVRNLRAELEAARLRLTKVREAIAEQVQAFTEVHAA